MKQKGVQGEQLHILKYKKDDTEISSGKVNIMWN